MQSLDEIHHSVRNRYPINTGATMPEPDRTRYTFHSVRQIERRVTETRRHVDRALETTGPWAVSVSFGKDSIVLWHIIQRYYPGMMTLFVDRSIEAELPETPRVIEILQAMQPFLMTTVRPKQTIFGLYRQLGGIPGLTTQKPDSIIRKITLVQPSDDWMRSNGYTGIIMGRRIEENLRTRGKHLTIRGALHYNKERAIWTCDPLLHWSAVDIWAYIAQYNLPYPPAYDLDPVGREQARMSSWSGMAGARYGRWVLVKRFYPELWNYFVSQFPEARAYV